MLLSTFVDASVTSLGGAKFRLIDHFRPQLGRQTTDLVNPILDIAQC
jgi:hypothetical protein